jgi:L-threonate 2-dehydrogenase
VMAVSSGNSAVFESRGRKFLLANQYQPGFMTELMRKDIALAVEMAQRLKVPTPVASSALQQYTAAMNHGHAREDFAAVTKVCEQAAGVKLVD